jgi:hypothetical protein
MDDIDSDIADAFGQIQFKAPRLETVWAPGRRASRSGRRRLTLVLGLAAALAISGGALAANSPIFQQFLPKGGCSASDVTCGPKYAVVGISLDQIHDVRVINVIAAPDLTSEDLLTIARRVAGDTSGPAESLSTRTHRVIVYIYSGLTADQVNAFPAAPIDDSVSAAPPPDALSKYWRLTYDLGAAGEQVSWPGKAGPTAS